MDVSVLVVSYRRADLLARCLDSVARWLPGAAVHVWDNASDGSADVRRESASRPGVQWTFSPGNAGFAVAVNRLVAAADPGHDLLLLNPDAVLTGDLAGTRALLAEPRVAAAAPFVEGSARARPWDNAHRAPGLARSLVSHAGYAGGSLRGTPASDLYRRPPTSGVGYLTGSCLLVRRRAWEDVGPLDERYFLYAEEADWAERARRRGWSLRLCPEHGARHVGHGTVSGHDAQSARSLALLHESQRRYLADHHGPLAPHAYEAGVRLLGRVQRSKRAARAAGSGR